MLRLAVRIAFCLVALCSAFSIRAAMADEAGQKKEVTALLDEGWIVKEDGWDKIDEHRKAADAAAPADVRGAYAMLIVQLHAHKYQEAADTAVTIVKQFPDHLPTRESHIWIRALHKENAAAIGEMIALALKLNKVDAKHGATEEQKAAAKFLGQMCGYLAGPAAFKPTDGTMADKQAAIVNSLASELHDSFDAGRHEADEKFKQLQASQPVADPAADAKLADLKTKFVADENAQKKSIADLHGKLEGVAKQANDLQKKITDAETAAKKIESDAKRETNPVKIAAAKVTDKTMHDAIAKDQKDLQKLQGDANKIKADGAQQQKDLNHLVQQHKADAAKLSGTSATADSTATSADDPKPKTELKSLAGYVPLDLDGQKKRLLESFSGT